MPITEAQRLARIGKINASDIGAILGVDPWANAADKWAVATGRVERTETTAVMDAGTRLEGPILDWAAERYPIIGRNVHLEVPELLLSANLDALAEGGIPVEAKTAGLFGPLSEEWGPDGSDDVPYRVIAQIHVQLRCIPNRGDHGIVPAFIGGRGFCDFVIPWSDELWRIIEDACAAFRRCIETDTPPPNVTPSHATLRAMKRVPNRVVPVEPGLLSAYQQACALSTAAEIAKKDAKDALLAALGDAEAGDCGAAGGFTYLREKRAGYSVAPTEFPMLRIKKARKP